MKYTKLCKKKGCGNLAFSDGYCAVHLPGIKKIKKQEFRPNLDLGEAFDKMKWGNGDDDGYWDQDGAHKK